METREFESLGTCPNCDSKSFDIITRTCPECGYKFLDFDNTEKTLFETFEENNRNSFEKYNFEKGDYKIYAIKKVNGKIVSIKFKKKYANKEYSFLIGLDYSVSKKTIVEKNFYETDPDENRVVDILKIENLKIYEIFQKAKVGYKEKKYSANYFKYLGMNTSNLSKFIYDFLNNFHK